MVAAAAGPAAIATSFPALDGDAPDSVRHRPGGRHWLDPDPPDLFRRRLEELRIRQHRPGGQPCAGCVQMLDLQQVRLRFGRRWPALRDKALQFVAAALERMLGDHDLYLLADEDRIHLLCSGLPHEDAERRAQLLAGAITERLCGANPGGAAVRVRSVPADLGRLLEGIVDPQELQGRVAEALARAETVLPDRPPPAALVPAVAWQPVLAPARGLVAAYRLNPAVPDARAYPPGDDPDLWSIEVAAAALPATAARGRKALLIVPIRYETLASIRLREPFCRACRRLPRSSAHRLLFEVGNLPPDIVQSRVRELMAYLRPFCLGILAELAEPQVAHLTGAGIVGVAMDDLRQALELAGLAHRHGLRSFLTGLRSAAECREAAQAGVDYLAGSFAPSLPRPGPVVRLAGSARPLPRLR